MRKFLASLIVASAVLSAMPAAAHQDVPLAGKITAVTAKTIDVVTSEGEIVTLDVDNNTRVAMDGKRLTPKDIKIGQTVNVLGYGDSMTDLTAIDVTIASPGKSR
uniref:hypothetical protein n=1 Tax=uncultured Caulobacter sp. TaxID=158749 RepID=UPI0025DF8470|nr:hypothetical protein [uncultured Caulobacter sp.]